MKQHITIEQLSELDDKAKEKLRKWFYTSIKYDDDQVLMYLPDQDNRIIGGDWDQEINIYDMKNLKIKLIQKLKNYEGKMYPLLSIGQMIEFILENKKHIFMGNCLYGLFLNSENYGFVVGTTDNLDSIITDIDSQDYELCDALWEAVKYILNK